MIAPEYTSFFNSLTQNNSKEWFHANKKTYDEQVKKPFLELLSQLITRLEPLEPNLDPDAKAALFRINRDIRFSKDKTPYNTLMKASLVPGGKKSGWPGYHLGIGSEHIHVGGGLIGVKSPALKSIRALIATETAEFMAIMEDPTFVELYGTLQGEQAKRIDKAYKALLAKTPHIANKQFYAMKKLPLAGHLNSEKIADEIMVHFKAIFPLNQYLKKAFI